MADASNSLITNTNLVSKVYFPRLIVPTATIAAAFIDFFIGLLILAVMMAWYRFLPPWQILLLPFFVVLAILASLGPGLWVTAVNVQYRDFRYVIPFLVQFGLYVSPVGFSSSVVPEKWRLLYSLNPLVGIIDGFRWCILGGARSICPASASASSWSLFFCGWGFGNSRKLEKTFADLI